MATTVVNTRTRIAEVANEHHQKMIIGGFLAALQQQAVRQCPRGTTTGPRTLNDRMCALVETRVWRPTGPRSLSPSSG